MRDRWIQSNPPEWLLAGMLAGSCLLGACHGPLNESNQLLGTVPLSALEPTMPRLVTEPGAAELAGIAIAPLDRSGFQPIVILIQPAQVEHEPTYRSFEPLIASSARAEGAWPTPASALSLQVDNGAAALDGLIEPFRPAVELVLAPVSLIVTPPFTIQRAPNARGPLLPEQRHAAPWRWVQPPEHPSDVVQPR